MAALAAKYRVGGGRAGDNLPINTKLIRDLRDVSSDEGKNMRKKRKNVFNKFLENFYS